MTLSNLESTIFIGDKTFKGALQMDANPGSEKSSVTPGDWTAGANWAFAGTVCTHTAGATATLSRDTSEVANEVYRVVFPVASRTAGSVTMSIGGVSGTARSSNATFTEYIVATGTGNLTFTPSTDFDGNIDIASVSVKRVAVVAADRVTLWAGDRLAAGVEQAGDAGLFIRSEDGAINFLGDRILINAQNAFGRNTQLFEVNVSADEGGAALNTWSATAAEAAMLDFNRSKSATIGTKTIVAIGDALGYMTWRGADGTNFIDAAQIAAYVDATPDANDMGGRLVLSTTPDGSATLVEAMRIDSSQRVFVGNKANAGLFFSSVGAFQSRQEGTNNQLRLQLMGTGVDNYLAFDRSRGTFSTPTAIQTGDKFGIVIGVGYDGVSAGLTHGPQLQLIASENWSATNNGCQFDFVTIPVGSTSPSTTVSFTGIRADFNTQVQIDYAIGTSITAIQNLNIRDTSAMAANVGGGISFSGCFANPDSITEFATIKAIKENATDANYATALLFATRANGGSLAERLRIDSAGDFTFFDGGDFILGSTTGTKIGTAVSQKLAFYNATPVVQGLAVADASGGATIDAEARTAINALLARIRTLGLIAT